MLPARSFSWRNGLFFLEMTILLYRLADSTYIFLCTPRNILGIHSAVDGREGRREGGREELWGHAGMSLSLPGWMDRGERMWPNGSDLSRAGLGWAGPVTDRLTDYLPACLLSLSVDERTERTDGGTDVCMYSNMYVSIRNERTHSGLTKATLCPARNYCPTGATAPLACIQDHYCPAGAAK